MNSVESSACPRSLLLLLSGALILIMSQGPKKCKGCGSNVVNPVTCTDCGVISHPGPTCLARSLHPWYDGRLLNCQSGATTPQVVVDSNAAQPIQSQSPLPSMGELMEFLRVEFATLRQEMASKFKTEFTEIRSGLDALSECVRMLEGIGSSTSGQIPSPSGSPPQDTKDVIGEIMDRQARASNLILFGLPEPENPSAEISRAADAEEALTIVRRICPGVTQVQRTHRLGKSKGSASRTLCIRLDSPEAVKQILRNKHRYKGPYKISEDRTQRQRQLLDQLRGKLRSLHEGGELAMTIRYINGVPKIVLTRQNRVPTLKNASGIL